MKICENCGKEHDGSFGSGRFCCRSCANTHKCSKEQCEKTSNSLKQYYEHKGPSKKTFNYVKVKDSPGLSLPIRKCVICGELFYHLRDRKTCCPKCRELHQHNVHESFKNTSKIKYKNKKGWTEDAYKSIYQYYFTYKITNIVNDKYYLGIHATNNIDDGYMGSGKRINEAIKKYGKSNFKKEILEYFNCYKDLAEAEAKLITKEVLMDPKCYNLSLGGIGGPCFKDKRHTEETKRKLQHIWAQKRQKIIFKLTIWRNIYNVVGWDKFIYITQYGYSFKAFKRLLQKYKIFVDK